MAKLSAHGPEIARYLAKNGWLLSVREDGVTLRQTVCDRSWKVALKKKAGVPLEQWKAGKMEKIAALPAWRRSVKSLPSMSQLSEWASDSVCETVTGDTVEPDGHGADGAPSWLLALGMI